MLPYNSNSQVAQDIFAILTTDNQTYIEIGAWRPIRWNNTYLLETNGWQGFSVEYSEEYKLEWAATRKNAIYWANAMTFDYKSKLEENKLSSHIGYLSCDIEPAENTFTALRQIIEQGITFDCITFEHDKYQSAIDIDPAVREYLSKHGYKVAVTDVYRQIKNSIKMFETWFVRDSMEYTSQSYDQWTTNRTCANINNLVR
jgi:hypothetical protein